MSRAGIVTAGLIALGATIVVAPAVLMLMAAVTGGENEVAGGCEGEVVAGGAGPAGAAALSPGQLANAHTVIAVGTQMRVPARGIVVALAVAHQESGFRNYANDGAGGDLQSDQVGIGRSLGRPHDAVGTDHGSLGVFQQQWPWWGSMAELMDPAVSAEKFYERLLLVPGWQEMSVTDAGQAVQRSAYPDAYADDEAVAVELLDGSATQDLNIVPVAAGGGVGSGCLTPVSFSGRVVAPLPTSSHYSDLRNFGGSGPHWETGHTGTDLSVACGTPVLAAHDGTVVIRTDEEWAGKWLVQVSAGEGRLTTWYAHMQAIDVADGQVVAAGQQLGAVGALGNATGCHLHFEVHPHGGGIHEDAVDPSDWLKEHLSTDIRQVVAESAADPGYVLASFNVLGYGHTEPRGNKPGWASGDRRMRATVRLLDGYGVAVVGFQELAPRQKRVFLGLAGDRYGVYSPRGDTTNSIAWHRGQFAFVSANSFPVPSFKGEVRPMPIVRLRDLVTGQDSIYINVHNAADTARFPHEQRYRNAAVRRERAMVRALAARYDVPIFLTGDMNERQRVFCAMTEGGLLSSAAGGSNFGRCRPPRDARIDWIFGTRTNWAGYTRVQDSVQGSVSDHALVLAQVVEPISGGR